MADFPYFDWLARYYEQKGESSGHWRYYLQAHGLANFCLSEEPTETRRRLVYEIEKSWYKGKHPLTYSEHQVLTADHKQLLEKYREEARADFGTLDGLVGELSAEDALSEQNQNGLEAFCKKLFLSSEKCSEHFVNVSEKLIRSSVDILERQQQRAPCRFAVIALGSVAKGEATPYSDLEYAFLVERKNEYFERLAMDSYFRIGNLGETPLKCFDISELKDTSQFCSFATGNTKFGFGIDGITKHSGNIPTGNGLDPDQTMTFTLEELMIFYKTSATSPFDGFAGDKSDMLSSTVLAFTNEREGKSQLLEQFREARSQYEKMIACRSDTVNDKRRRSFFQDMKSYSFLPDFVSYQPPNNLNIKVKTDIFRYPTLLANNLKMCLGLDFNYPWETYTHLKEQGILSVYGHLYLSIVLALSIYIRTKAYIEQKCKVSFIQIDPTMDYSLPNVHYVSANLFALLGFLLIPIKQVINSSILMLESAEDPSSLKDQVASVIQDLVKFQTNHLQKAEVLYFTGQYDSAKEELSKAIGQPLESTSCSTFLSAIHHLSDQPTDPETLNKYLELSSYLLYYTNNYKVALNYFEWFIDTEWAQKGFWKLLSAHCHKENGDYLNAQHLLKEANISLRKCKEGETQALRTLMNPAYPDLLHRDVSMTLRNIGNLYRVVSEYDEALGYHKRALEIDKALYGDIAHSDIAADYNEIGLVYSKLGNHALSLEYHNMSLAMSETIYGADTNRAAISTSYSNIGVTYSRLGNHALSLEYHTKSVAMKKGILGENTNHTAIAASYNNIALVYNDLGEHALSLAYHTKSLSMEKALYGADANHIAIATSYDNIGQVYSKMGNYSLSLECHMIALAMYKALFGADTNHTGIATCYNNIGLANHNLGNYARSLENHIKSLAMHKAIYGTDVNHIDIARSYNNIGLGYGDLGNYALSLEYHIKSLAMHKAIYGVDANHTDIATSYNNIGLVYSELGNYKLSLEYHNKSLTMDKAIYGANTNHPVIATSYNNIAVIHSKLGSHALSLEYHIKSSAMHEAIYGSGTNHPDIAADYNNIGVVHGDLGNHTLSLDCHLKSLAMHQAIYGERCNHVSIAINYDRIGLVYRNLGYLSLSLEYHSKSLAIKALIYGTNTDHAHIAISYERIGRVYGELGYCELSLEYHAKSLAMKNAIYGADTNHAAIATSYDDIGCVYNTLGDYTSSLEYHLKSLAIYEAVYGAESKHPHIVKLRRNIGEIYRKLGHDMLALQYDTKAASLE